jgi:hypothetical protein
MSLENFVSWIAFYLGAKHHCKFGKHIWTELPSIKVLSEVRGCPVCGKLQVNGDDEIWRDVDLNAKDYAAFAEHQISMGPGRHNCRCELCQRVTPKLKEAGLW